MTSRIVQVRNRDFQDFHDIPVFPGTVTFCNENTIWLQTINLQDINDLSMHANLGGHVTYPFCILSRWTSKS